jgi:hemerythrin superfamily protein
MATPRTHSGPGGTRVPAGRATRVAEGTSATAIDAIELLESDHRHVEAWFAEFASATTHARKQDLAERICRALRVHMRIEEEIFYPAFLDAVGDRPLHDDAEAAHEQAREVIADIEACDAGDDGNFDILVQTLARMIERHVTDEEQPGGMFDEARQSDLDLYDLGARLEHRKLELMDDAETDAGYDAAVLGSGEPGGPSS